MGEPTTVMKFVIYAMIYLGSALMVYNVYSYSLYAKHILEKDNWDEGRSMLTIPVALLVLFLLGYLAVGLFGKPDLVVSGILFGGSIFVFVIFLLVQRITDRIQENEHLEAELMAAEQSNRAKTSFLSSVSHEMRTPMNAIIGLDTIALKDPDLSPGTRNHLEKIGLSARYLQNLISNILDLSRIESGKMVLSVEVFSFREVLDLVDLVTEDKCAEKGLEFRKEVVGAVGEYYLGDAVKLQQVLLSLLDNAVKFTSSPGCVTFRTELAAADGDRHTLHFTVNDNGIGISEEFQPKLFESFAQEDTSTTNRYGGSGLGLSLAKSIVDMMGGKITVKSEKGTGSTFTLEVTLREVQKPEQDEARKESCEKEEETADAVPLKGKRVMIVDDIELNADIVANLLEMEEIETEWAENGQIALSKFSESPEGTYDAILMDLRMPVMDGFDATRAIRALLRTDAKTVPIIALTANAFEEDKKKCREAGIDFHLSKPVDADILYETLGRLISRQC